MIKFLSGYHNMLGHRPDSWFLSKECCWLYAGSAAVFFVFALIGGHRGPALVAVPIHLVGTLLILANYDEVMEHVRAKGEIVDAEVVTAEVVEPTRAQVTEPELTLAELDPNFNAEAK